MLWESVLIAGGEYTECRATKLAWWRDSRPFARLQVLDPGAFGEIADAEVRSRIESLPGARSQQSEVIVWILTARDAAGALKPDDCVPIHGLTEKNAPMIKVRIQGCVRGVVANPHVVPVEGGVSDPRHDAGCGCKDRTVVGCPPLPVQPMVPVFKIQ